MLSVLEASFTQTSPLMFPCYAVSPNSGPLCIIWHSCFYLVKSFSSGYFIKKKALHNIIFPLVGHIPSPLEDKSDYSPFCFTYSIKDGTMKLSSNFPLDLWYDRGSFPLSPSYIASLRFYRSNVKNKPFISKVWVDNLVYHVVAKWCW